jgi:hypothetical protein
MRQGEPDDAGRQQRAALAGNLPARQPSATVIRRDLDEIGGRRADLAAEGETLQQPRRDDDDGRGIADG